MVVYDFVGDPGWPVKKDETGWSDCDVSWYEPLLAEYAKGRFGDKMHTTLDLVSEEEVEGAEYIEIEPLRLMSVLELQFGKCIKHLSDPFIVSVGGLCLVVLFEDGILPCSIEELFGEVVTERDLINWLL